MPPRRRSLTDYTLFAEAVGALALASLVVRLLPFRWLTQTLSWDGRRHVTDSSTPAVIVAIDRASRRTPWRTVCIHRGLAAQWMLRRRGVDARFHYGLSQTNSALTAHVWVSVDDNILVGEDEAARYKCVAKFPAAERTAST